MWSFQEHLLASEWVNGTSAPLGYTVYSDIHVDSWWKIRDRRQIKTDKKLHKLNTTQNSKKQQNHYPGSVAFYNTRPGNEMGLVYNTARPTCISVTVHPHKATDTILQFTMFESGRPTTTTDSTNVMWYGHVMGGVWFTKHSVRLEKRTYSRNTVWLT